MKPYSSLFLMVRYSWLASSALMPHAFTVLSTVQFLIACSMLEGLEMRLVLQYG